MSPKKPDPNAHLLFKAFWVLRHRSAQLLPQIRSYWTFWFQYQLNKLWPLSGVELEPNVRFQKRRCLLAETPGASIRIGAHSIIYEHSRLEAFGKGRIEIGEDSSLGEVRINCRGSVRIGKRFLAAWGIFIQDCETHPLDAGARGLQSQINCRNFQPSWATREDKMLPALDWIPEAGAIEIGDNVWVGANCTILKNVKIGSGTLVASGSVVTSGTYPDNALLAGNPARVVKIFTSTPETT